MAAATLVGPEDVSLLGAVEGTAVYLLYNGILRDKSPDGGNVLTRDLLAGLPAHDGPRVVYGTGCLLSPDFMRQVGVVFRQRRHG